MSQAAVLSILRVSGNLRRSDIVFQVGSRLFGDAAVYQSRLINFEIDNLVGSNCLAKDVVSGTLCMTQRGLEEHNHFRTLMSKVI